MLAKTNLQMKYLGIDYGTKKVGVALCEGILPYPYKTLDTKRAVGEICRMVDEEKVQVIVVGQPTEKISKPFRQFIKDIKALVRAKLIIWDETLSSQKAREYLIDKNKKQKQQEHAIAACIILEDYLNSQ